MVHYGCAINSVTCAHNGHFCGECKSIHSNMPDTYLVSSRCKMSLRSEDLFLLIDVFTGASKMPIPPCDAAFTSEHLLPPPPVPTICTPQPQPHVKPDAHSDLNSLHFTISISPNCLHSIVLDIHYLSTQYHTSNAHNSFPTMPTKSTPPPTLTSPLCATTPPVKCNLAIFPSSSSTALHTATTPTPSKKKRTTS